MLNPPEDLDTGTVAEALERGWLMRVRALAYLPLGFGAHHWAADTAAGRFFVTAHDLRLSGAGQDPLVQLARTFRAARMLREQGQLSLTFGGQLYVKPLQSALLGSRPVHIPGIAL